jgi:homoserine O-acetyltransferase/O-succinyltransferase
MRTVLPLVSAFVIASTFSALAAEDVKPVEGDAVLHDFTFTSGERMGELRIHYRTVGKPRRDEKGEVTNAVLVLHGTTGNGGNFIRPEFSGVLFGPGAPLDATQYFVVLPDGIGHGQSSKPSDGLHGHFPRYGYRDMVEAERRLLAEAFGVTHLRLVMGTSMGGMHTWLWGELHPQSMDALMPLASLPVQIAGRNRAWRKLVSDAIRGDPEWKGGDYRSQPPSLRVAAEMLWFMGSSSLLRMREEPTRAAADAAIDSFAAAVTKEEDANDILYAVEASWDYDPEPALERIEAPLVAVNTGDDLINPPELGVLEREIRRVRRGRFVLIPQSDATRGHGSHTLAALWKDELVALLRNSSR